MTLAALLGSTSGETTSCDRCRDLLRRPYDGAAVDLRRASWDQPRAIAVGICFAVRTAAPPWTSGGPVGINLRRNNLRRSLSGSASPSVRRRRRRHPILNNAMSLWAKVKGKSSEIKGPQSIAEALVKNFPSFDIIEKTAVFASSTSQGTILDSGTTLAYLVEEAHDPFVDDM